MTADRRFAAGMPGRRVPPWRSLSPRRSRRCSRLRGGRSTSAVAEPERPDGIIVVAKEPGPTSMTSSPWFVASPRVNGWAGGEADPSMGATSSGRRRVCRVPPRDPEYRALVCFGADRPPTTSTAADLVAKPGAGERRRALDGFRGEISAPPDYSAGLPGARLRVSAREAAAARRVTIHRLDPRGR
jgi:hypothetical protein